MGTTASAPVFDHTVDPPVLAGVVGMDISFAALEQAFGEQGANQDQVIQQIIQRSGAVCPTIELNACQLESLRKYGSDDEGNHGAVCGSCSGTISQLQAPLCQDYATVLWDNDLNKGRSYEERACCHVGSDPRIKGSLSYEKIKEDHVCLETQPSIALIVGLSVPAAIIGISIIGFFIRRHIKINRQKRKQESRWPSIKQEIKSFEDSVVVMPHPTAPVASI